MFTFLTKILLQILETSGKDDIPTETLAPVIITSVTCYLSDQQKICPLSSRHKTKVVNSECLDEEPLPINTNQRLITGKDFCTFDVFPPCANMLTMIFFFICLLLK